MKAIRLPPFPYWLGIIPIYVLASAKAPQFLTFQAAHCLLFKVVKIELIPLFDHQCFSRFDSMKNSVHISLLSSLTSIV